MSALFNTPGGTRKEDIDPEAMCVCCEQMTNDLNDVGLCPDCRDEEPEDEDND